MECNSPLLESPSDREPEIRRKFPPFFCHPSLPLETFMHLCIRPFLAIILVAASLLIAPNVHAEDGVYVVGRGEFLSQIAESYGVSLHDLIAANGITNPNIVYVGQRLVIPGSTAAARYATPANPAQLPGSEGYITVGRGDTLSQIAKDHGMTLWDIMRLNGLSSPNFIWVGQQLRVSARVTAVAPEKEAELKVANSIHVVKVGDTLSQIAKDYGVTSQELLVANGLPNANFVWVGQRLRINAAPAKQQVAVAPSPSVAPSNGYRYIEINLSNQTLTAWQGGTAMLHTSVSTGTSRTPTVTGRFPIYMKLSSQHMTGPGYSLPGVPWVMYFYQGYAIHGTYWHNNFGTPMSHGCINMRTNEAEFLYSWAGQGTEVYVHY